MKHFSAPQLAALLHWDLSRVESCLSAFRILPDKFSGEVPLYGVSALRTLEDQNRVARELAADLRSIFKPSPLTQTVS
jgi:hypothetical protein